MPVAYKIPLTNYREEFDELDLRNQRQHEVSCPLGCGTRYSLVCPSEATAEAVAYYKVSLEAGMGACNQHNQKITLNF
jgi:hypothetical protein